MIILHGENTERSRRFLIEKIKQFKGEVIRFEGEKVPLTELKQALESTSLFGQDRLIIVENIFSSRISKQKKEVLEYLKNTNPQNLIIWEGKKIDGKILSPFSSNQIERFDLASIIFKFLDSFSPTNKRMSLFLFHQSLKNEPVEIIFYMLCRHVKDLIIAADLGEEGLKEFPPWKRKKLINQAKNFDIKKLLYLFHKFLEIDYRIKTGKTLLNLISYIDLLIINL